MKHGFLKVGTAVPKITVADCDANGRAILSLAQEAAAQGVRLLVFPELAITGATCGDLFRSPTLLQAAADTLEWLLQETAGLDMVLAVGLPTLDGLQVHNSCAVCYRGELLQLVQKSRLLSSEQRFFANADPRESLCDFVLAWESFSVPVRVVIGQALPQEDSGALLLLHPYAAAETVVSEERRLSAHRVQSCQQCCAILSAGAGQGESTTDQVYAGQCVIAENGTLLSVSPVFSTGLTVTELDVDLLRTRRLQRELRGVQSQGIPLCYLPVQQTALSRMFPKNPFLPLTDKAEISQRIRRILEIQCAGLGQRLLHTHARCAVVGLSGGLDSTLALLVTALTFDRIGKARGDILAITMPCFGTTRRTKSNAEKLADALGVSFREISISKAVEQHFADIGQSMAQHDVTFENAQARERTQVLMDVANQHGGLVIGTGDLSELALGWATYNGDHMSMYSVNGGIPKTLMRHVVRELAESGSPALRAVLEDILDTPVSPELLPAKAGEISQKTEELVGPYELHDFFLYHALGNGCSPQKLQRLAKYVFAGSYSDEEIDHWLKNFYRRFFGQQFKRSCLPDGPAVGRISVSPRGGLVLPSDASGALWQQQLQTQPDA